MKRVSYGRLLGAASAFSLVLPAAAHAQAAPEVPAADNAGSDIVVTAQRREEKLQDVPISITTLSGDQLDRSSAQDVSDVLASLPAIAALPNYQGGQTQIAIRGIAASAAALSGSSPVSYYLDSMPFGLVNAAFAPDAGLYDLNRIEVLRGPQGTLYGASAAAGVVRILTNDADVTRFEAKARAIVSAVEHGGENYRADAAINVPIITDKLAVRLVGSYQKLGGWIDRPNATDVNDGKLRDVRLKVAVRPTEQLSVDLLAWLSRGDFGAPNSGRTQTFTPSTQSEPIETNFDLYSARVGYEGEAIALTATASWFKYYNNGFIDYAPFVAGEKTLQTLYDPNVFNGEVNLSSTGAGSWRWSVGAIYRNNSEHFYQHRSLHLFWTESRGKSESWAAFGEVTRLLGDGRFELTGGLRYFEDRISTQQIQNAFGQPLTSARDKFDAITPRVIAKWKPNPDLNIYASYSQGFRSGLVAAPPLPSSRPDRLHNYELGVKGSALDRKVRFEGAVYYMRWKDVQQQIGVNIAPPPNIQLVTAVFNGPSASGPGFEASLTYLPIRGLTLGAAYSWNDIKLDGDVTTVVAGTPAVIIAKGDRLNFSMKETASASIDYTFPLGSGEVEGRLGASIAHASPVKYRALFPNVLVAQSGSITTARATIGIDTPSGLGASLFVDNLTGEDDAVVGNPYNSQFNQQLQPRTWGLQVSFKF